MFEALQRGRAGIAAGDSKNMIAAELAFPIDTTTSSESGAPNIVRNDPGVDEGGFGTSGGGAAFGAASAVAASAVGAGTGTDVGMGEGADIAAGDGEGTRKGTSGRKGTGASGRKSTDTSGRRRRHGRRSSGRSDGRKRERSVSRECAAAAVAAGEGPGEGPSAVGGGGSAETELSANPPIRLDARSRAVCCPEASVNGFSKRQKRICVQCTVSRRALRQHDAVATTFVDCREVSTRCVRSVVEHDFGTPLAMHGAAVCNFNVVLSNDQDEGDELEILAKWWLDQVHLCPRCESHVCRNDADLIVAHQRRCPGGSGGDDPCCWCWWW